MASGFALIDNALTADLVSSENDFRNIMLLARRLRQGEFEINGDTLKLFEDFLFTANIGLTSVRTRIEARLAQYRDLGESAFDAVASLENDAFFAVAPFIVITGTYRPIPANDHHVGGAA